MELLENFRATGAELAFVIDEYGEVLGIVTPQDVMEAITGEFKPQRRRTRGRCSARTARGCSTD